MIIFLLGPDEYRREQKAKDIINQYRQKNSEIGIKYFNFEVDSFIELKDFILTGSLFSVKKMAILKNVSLIEKEVFPIFEKVLKDENIYLLVLENSLGKNFKKFLKKPALIENFPYLTGSNWLNFVKKLVVYFKLEMDSDIIRLLSLIYQNNTYALATELEKLSFLKRKITKKDLLTQEPEKEFFEKVKSLQSFNLTERLRAYLNLSTEPAGKIFNILSVLKPQKKIDAFATADWLVKSGKLDYEEAILKIILG